MKLKLLAMAGLLAASALAKPVFITHPGVVLDKGTAEKILEGRVKSLPDGSSYTLGVTYFDDESTDQNIKGLTGKSAKRIKSVWTKLQFSGKGVMPTEFGSQAELVEWVASTDGAIAVVDDAHVTSNVNVL
tara:strand:+ start:8527 stop:8919 length:393 start_codon:yes stop_codon:yes gene_type:complete